MDKIKEVTQDEFFEFLDLLSRLNPIEFLGVATLLDVPCFEDLERQHPRDTEALMSDVMDQFLLASHTKRKNLIKKMKKAARK